MFWEMKLKIMASLVFSVTELVIEILCWFLEQTKSDLRELGQNTIYMVKL